LAVRQRLVCEQEGRRARLVDPKSANRRLLAARVGDAVRPRVGSHGRGVSRRWPDRRARRRVGYQGRSYGWTPTK